MKYVAFLRGINVGGKNMIKMERLREIVADLGFKNVRTYINSGNVLFETKTASDKTLAKKIYDAIQKSFNMDISVMVRTIEEIERIIAENPYVGQFDNDKDVHVFFLGDELSNDHRELLLANNSDVELITVKGRAIYYMLRISILDSSLGKGFIEKKLKIPTTARNWRTINKIAAM
ncbi:MAG: DUF1697 domain-containing protein [Acidobacteriota bacterium]